jgi:crotonobetainyl-CoA:carnitine CoA-transferase CaiB-like acyl-CoA transferase
VRVVDLTNLLPGPYATMILGDFGADIIKVERPGGGDPGRVSEPLLGGESARHRTVNRNKRSIVLDLKDPGGLATMRALVARSDVLVEGFRPGTMSRLGLGYEDLKDAHPGLVYCSINGFGSSAAENPPAHDLNFMALAGLLPPCAVAGPVALPGTQFADLAAGSLRAVIGTLMALMERQRSGLGQFVDVSMSRGALSLQLEALAYLNAGQPVGVGSTRLTGRYPCYRLYPTKDDRLMAVAATEPAFWRNLCTVLGVPELVDEQYADGAAGDEVVARLEERFRTRTLTEWELALRGKDTCCTPVLTSAEAIDRAAPDQGVVFDDVIDGGQVFRHFGPVVSLSRTSGDSRRRAPELGEHAEEILSELGNPRPQERSATR